MNNTYIADFSRKLYIYVRYSNHRMAPPSVIILADPCFDYQEEIKEALQSFVHTILRFSSSTRSTASQMIIFNLSTYVTHAHPSLHKYNNLHYLPTATSWHLPRQQPPSPQLPLTQYFLTATVFLDTPSSYAGRRSSEHRATLLGHLSFSLKG